MNASVFRLLKWRPAWLVVALPVFCTWPGLAHGQSSNPGTTNTAGNLVFANGFADLNDDGQVNVLDIVRITHHLNGTKTLPPTLIPRADITQDGRVTAGDRTIMVEVILERRTKPTDDFDYDELTNQDELGRGTNPFEPDSDHDTVWDGMEVADNTDPLNSQSHARVIFLAQPPVAILSPLSEGPVPTNAGPVRAYPNVRVALAALDRLEGTETTIAKPPVEVVLPAVESASGRELTLARPPVALIQRESEPLSIAGTNGVLAQPPLRIALPLVDEMQPAAFRPVLGHPPLTITGPPQ